MVLAEFREKHTVADNVTFCGALPLPFHAFCSWCPVVVTVNVRPKVFALMRKAFIDTCIPITEGEDGVRLGLAGSQGRKGIEESAALGERASLVRGVNVVDGEVDVPVLEVR